MECHVYITLPRATTAVTAGTYRLTALADGDIQGEFAYERSYTENGDAVELDPLELPLAGVTPATKRSNGIFGSLRDACPDAWGRKIVEQRLAVPGAELPEIAYMLNTPDDRAGALGFGAEAQPPGRGRGFHRPQELPRLMAIADRLIGPEHDLAGAVPGGMSRAPEAGELLHAGTSLGGARSKVTVEDRGALWVAKFTQPGDGWNNPRVEHGTMQLARECGISAASTQVVTFEGRDVLLVRRFDRDREESGYASARMISGLTMLGLEEGDHGRWSYLDLARALRRHASADVVAQLSELFRRMTFNALVSNTDDHPRNHAFLAKGSSWNLSPAYDLTPTPSMSHTRRLAMKCGLQGRDATRANVLSACGEFQLSREDAESAVDAMTLTVLESWHRTMMAAGVTQADAERIRSAFVCEGFGGRLPVVDG